MNNKMKKLLGCLIALIGGVVFIVMGVTGMSQAKNFPEVQVTVTNIETTESTDADGNITTESTVYVSYTVDGKEYNEILQDAQGDLQEGATITARYNPEKPSYVTTTSKGSGIFRVIFGAVFALVGLIGGLLTIIRGR